MGASRGRSERDLELIRRLHREIDKYLRYFPLTDHEREEIIQETAIAAWLNMGSLREEEKLLAWIKAIARNKAKRHCIYRGKYNERTCSLEKVNDFLESSHGQYDTYIYDDPQKLGNTEIYWAVKDLGEPDATILILNKVHGHRFDDIARALQLTPITVRSISSRAFKKLRRDFKQSPK